MFEVIHFELQIFYHSNNDYHIYSNNRFHTTTSLTPDEVHEIGLQEVAAIESRYSSDVLIPLGFDPADFKSFLHHVQSESQFYEKSGEALLDRYKAMCSKIQSILPR